MGRRTNSFPDWMQTILLKSLLSNSIIERRVLLVYTVYVLNRNLYITEEFVISNDTKSLYIVNASQSIKNKPIIYYFGLIRL